MVRHPLAAQSAFPNMKIERFTNPKSFIEKSIELIQDICSKNPNTIYIALSGGSTPEALYKAMAKADLPFERIEFYTVDERYVPHDHLSSNSRMIHHALIKHSKPKAFNHVDTSLPIEEAVIDFSKRLPIEGFDLIILGIGQDGHTASLFPHLPALTSDDTVSHTITDEFEIKDRITLTFNPILASKNLLVLLKGTEKLPTLLELQKTTEPTPEDIQDYPAKRLITHPNLHIFFHQS